MITSTVAPAFTPDRASVRPATEAFTEEAAAVDLIAAPEHLPYSPIVAMLNSVVLPSAAAILNLIAAAEARTTAWSTLVPQLASCLKEDQSRLTTASEA